MDKFFGLVDDIEAIMGDKLDVPDPTSACDMGGNDTTLMDEMSAAWVMIEAPIAMRKYYGLNCNSSRYVLKPP